MKNLSKWWIGPCAALCVVTTHIPSAQACGCFTPPDPSVPVVQAGERIVFAMENGQVTAHIQIQYQGSAAEFGWLLPLPSVPTLDLGTDELFNALTTSTQPKYRLNRAYEGNCSFDPSRSSGFNGAQGAPSAGGSGEDTGSLPPSPLVIQDSIGPYDYAVLRADSKDAMLAWLADNRYFVPAGTDETVGAYIRPGAYFLALKLRSGNSAGDLQPVVLKYASDLPMIPIVLTSVGANPNMGVQVWMLGKGRAIPRNYYHTVINDALIDWNTSGRNYNDVIIQAVGEAVGKHSFVTEFAGKSAVMQGVLNAPGRFGSASELAAQSSEIAFVQYLFSHGFTFTSQLGAVLGRFVPVPPALIQKQRLTAAQFYQNIGYWLTTYRAQNPQDFVGYAVNYQPAEMAQEIETRVIAPTLSAGELFDKFPYLTRLYSTLSPEDMNQDPVFSFNPGLKDLGNVHEAVLTYHCGFFGRSNIQTTPATLRTESGFLVQYPYGTGTRFTPPSGLPGSARIEVLAEEGAPRVVTDNTQTINGRLGGSSGCATTLSSRAGETAGGVVVLLLAGGLVMLRRRRRA